MNNDWRKDADFAAKFGSDTAWQNAANGLLVDQAAPISEAARGTQPEMISWEECPACGDRNRNDAQFCSNCGTELNRNPDNVVLAALIKRVTELEKVNAADAHFHEWSWASLDEGDRWRVWWGVFWRGLLANLGFVVVLILIIQAGSR